MKVNVIITEEDYENALKRMSELDRTEIVKGSAAYYEYRALAAMVMDYDRENSSGILDENLSPVEMIQFVMDQMGLRPRDMIPYFGSRQRVSDILNRRRSLTLPMMRKLSSGLGIPMDVLTPDYELEKPGPRKVKVQETA